MRNKDDVLKYARELSEQLPQDMRPAQGGTRGSWWIANGPEMRGTIDARGAAALEFLRQYAGPDSYWSTHAAALIRNRGRHSVDHIRDLSDVLREWCNQVEAGIVEIVGAHAWAEVGTVSTDLMSQVRRLLEDRETHPAAPIVLCGAALEIALRALADARSIAITPNPSLAKLTTTLRSAGILTVQDVKDLEQCGGIRNSAAHGDFDPLSRERAGLMEQQTNMLLRRLADLHP